MGAHAHGAEPKMRDQSAPMGTRITQLLSKLSYDLKISRAHGSSYCVEYISKYARTKLFS